MTKRFSEILTLLLTILVACVGLPFLMYFLSVNVFFKESKHITLVSTVIVYLTLFVLGLIYIVMTNVIKIRHYDTLLEGRSIIDKMAANKRQMRAIRNTINKDKDESVYGLDKYDDKLEELDQELEQISQEKQEAMTQFENETKQLLTDEVNDRRLGRLEQMQGDVEELEKKIALLEEDIKNSDLAITNNYGAVLGKEFCTPAKVADLISLMEDGTADTVSESIAAYKGAGR
jgi:alanyl-tRNA synthetase